MQGSLLGRAHACRCRLGRSKWLLLELQGLLLAAAQALGQAVALCLPCPPISAPVSAECGPDQVEAQKASSVTGSEGCQQGLGGYPNHQRKHQQRLGGQAWQLQQEHQSLKLGGCSTLGQAGQALLLHLAVSESDQACKVLCCNAILPHV